MKPATLPRSLLIMLLTLDRITFSAHGQDKPVTTFGSDVKAATAKPATGQEK